MTLKQTLLMCLLTGGLIATGSNANATIVRLHSSVTVDKSLVHLSDVADVFADDAQATANLESITLTTSPIPGNSTRLKLDDIRSRLTRFNIEIGALEFQGSSIVLVTRKGQLSDSGKTSFRTKLASATNRTAKPRPFRNTELASHATATQRTSLNLRTISTVDIRLAETVVHDLVQDYLSQWASDWGEPIITPLLASPTVPKLLSARADNLSIVSGKLISDDIFLLTVGIPIGDASPSETTTNALAPTNPTVERVQVRVRVTRRPKVLAARRTIPQGQTIHEADLEWREADDIRNGASEPETVVGMEARRTIRQGDFVKVSFVKPPTLIKRDDLVEVAVAYGTIHVTRTMKARSDGVLNDVIELVPRDGSRQGKMLARVTGNGKAEPLDVESDGEKSGVQLTRGPR
jgi:flagella basal body P-ring formation protein FlgA